VTTPAASRDRFVDLLRGGSIVAVVVGHWLVADLRWDGSQVTETSSLRAVPQMWPLTWLLVVIPLFFFVGGYSNRRSWEGVRRRGEGYAAYLDRRVHRVLVPTLVCVVVVASAGVLVDLLGGLGIGEVGGVMFQPLWFLAVYLWVVALAPATLWLHQRYRLATPVVLVALVGLGDVGRFALGWEWAGYVNVLTVWLLMHQLGYWYADGALSGRRPAALAVGGILGATLLVGVGPYPATMVGVTGGEAGNMHPPSAAMACLGLAQIGVALLLRDRLLGWLRRPRVFAAVIAVNLSMMTIYLWHQPALTLAARLVVPLGYPAPQSGTAAWWAAHLAWLLVPAVVLIGLVAVFRRFEQVSPPPPVDPGVVTATVGAIAVLVLGVGLLALAGSSVIEPWDPGQSLGPFIASPVWGICCLGLAAATFAVLRRVATHGRRRVTPA
jgi:Acyltransferase family